MMTAKEVTVDGEVVKLTPIEYRILLLLVKNQGRVFLLIRFMKVSGGRSNRSGQHGRSSYPAYQRKD